MNFIHFGLRIEIERLYLEWCAEEGIANKPNSMVVFLMEKGWLNEEQIIKDLNESKTGPQTEYKKWETKPAADLSTENTTCVGVAMALVEDELQIVDWGKQKSCTLELFDNDGNYIESKDGRG